MPRAWPFVQVGKLRAHIHVQGRIQLRHRFVEAEALRLANNRSANGYAAFDLVALKVLSVAMDLGLSAPKDLGIVGYDNTVICGLVQNDLTSVDQSGPVLGRQSARLLIERIRGRGEAKHILIQPTIVPRGSTACI